MAREMSLYEEIAKDAIDNGTTYKEVCGIMFKAMVEKALIKTMGNQSKAAIVTGINRGTLRKWLTVAGFKVQKKRKPR